MTRPVNYATYQSRLDLLQTNAENLYEKMTGSRDIKVVVTGLASYIQPNLTTKTIEVSPIALFKPKEILTEIKYDKTNDSVFYQKVRDLFAKNLYINTLGEPSHLHEVYEVNNWAHSQPDVGYKRIQNFMLAQSLIQMQPARSIVRTKAEDPIAFDMKTIKKIVIGITMVAIPTLGISLITSINPFLIGIVTTVILYALAKEFINRRNAYGINPIDDFAIDITKDAPAYLAFDKREEEKKLKVEQIPQPRFAKV